MRVGLLTAVLLAIAACSSPVPPTDTAAQPAAPAAAPHWEPAPVLGALPARPRSSSVILAPSNP